MCSLLSNYSWHIWTTSKIVNFSTQWRVPCTSKSNTQYTIRLSKCSEYSVWLVTNFVSYSACSKFNPQSEIWQRQIFSGFPVHPSEFTFTTSWLLPLKTFNFIIINNPNTLRYQILVAEVVMQKYNVSETQYCFF